MNQVTITINDATPELLNDIEKLVKDHREAKKAKAEPESPAKSRDINEPIQDPLGYQRWENEKSELHRVDGPAKLWRNGNYEYWFEGKPGRVCDTHLPSAKCVHMYYWYKNGEEIAAFNSTANRLWIMAKNISDESRISFSIPEKQ